MNTYGKISSYFIENKKLSLLILLGIILWGLISFIIMPKQYNPDIVAPAFLIDIDFPGATVDEVYQVVTKPLEDVLNEIPGVENIYSKSFHGGKCSVVVEFFVGEDLEESMIVLRQRISSRLNLKPLGVSEPYIISIDPEDLPVITLALSSNSVDSVGLRRIAFKLKDHIKAIKGTSLIDIIGGRKKEFQIILDPQKMKETKTSFFEINTALNNSSLLRDLGFIKSEEKYYKLETQDLAKSVKDIGNIVITANTEQDLRIKDVANVIEGEEEHESFVSYHKKDSTIENTVFIAISKIKGENITRVSRTINNKIKEIKDIIPELSGIDIDIVKDEGRVAKEEIYRLVINLLQAITIVFIVLFMFLNHRAAFIVAVSIPITLLTVFAIGNLFGYTINRITLFALILSLGLLVDSATVVIENIVRNKKLFPAKPKGELISESVSEVGMGLFLSTLTTVLAFIPMAFVTGMMGPYMGPLPFFVSTALIVSLIFAYTMNPWLASVFCKDKIDSEITKKCGFICKTSETFVNLYTRSLGQLLSSKRKRIVFLCSCFIILFIVMLFPAFRLLRFRMLPKADKEQLYIYIDLARGTSIERSNKVAVDLSEFLTKQENIISIQTFVGTPPVLDFNGMFKGVSDRRATNQITLKLNLTHPNSRDITSESLALQYRSIIHERLKNLADARFQVIEDPPGPPVRSTFWIKVKTDNKTLLESVLYDLEKKVKATNEVKDVDISLLEQNDKFSISIDKKEAAISKVSVESISEELNTIFGKKIIGIYHSDYNYEQEYIVLKYERNLRDSINDLDNIYIVNALGNHIPLSRFVKVQKSDEQDIIIGDNRQQTGYIFSEMGKRSVTYAAIDFLKMLYHYEVPANKTQVTKRSLLSVDYLVNNTQKLTIEIGGEWDLTVKVFRDLGMAMGIAIILIYFVLVAQFKSFLIPFLILSTIPLALIGVIPAFTILFWFFRIYFSATSMIGVIALAGIVVNNAIIYIEYVMQAINNNDSLRSTLLDAGSARLRPILLTSTTTVLGSLVIAMDPVWSGLAWSIVFGLSLSAVLTLVVFPVLLYQFLGERWYNLLVAK